MTWQIPSPSTGGRELSRRGTPPTQFSWDLEARNSRRIDTRCLSLGCGVGLSEAVGAAQGLVAFRHHIVIVGGSFVKNDKALKSVVRVPMLHTLTQDAN